MYNINDIEDLKQCMLINNVAAEHIYNRSKELGVLNEQFFMDWQDRLNKVTYVQKEDL